MATILLVEDNADLRDSIRARLKSDRHRVVEAADGAEAIHWLRLLTFDLIITDFSMPRMNGQQVIQTVAVREPTLPIILMSGGIEEQVLMCILHQFPSVRYLPKDVLSTQLRQLVQESLAS